MEEDRIQSGSLREHAEELETQTLSPYAMLSRNTRGREYPMENARSAQNLYVTGTASSTANPSGA